MNLDWQTAAVGLLVVVASVYLARLAWQTVARKRAAACGGCAKCPSNAAQHEPEAISVVQLVQAGEANRNGAGHDV